MLPYGACNRRWLTRVSQRSVASVSNPKTKNFPVLWGCRSERGSTIPL
jgi:hypothetical protein